MTAPLPDLSALAIPPRHRQIVLACGDTWSSPSGRLWRLDHDPATGAWNPVDDGAACAFGRAGFAWGRGLHVTLGGAPEKKESDARSPAGIFLLGPVYGYAENVRYAEKMNYVPVTSRHRFIEDPERDDYNQLVELSAGEQEALGPRDEHVYELGVVVQHNMHPVVSGAGSGILVHIWREAYQPTAGCTAIAREAMRRVAAWLDVDAAAILIQGPREAFSDLGIQ